MVNWNDRFRGFVRFANQLHDEGHLDVLVGTGDLYDYIHEHDDDPAGPGNAGFLRDLVLGRAPGPDFPDVEAFYRYAQDPVHLSVIDEFVRPILAARAAVQYHV